MRCCCHPPARFQSCATATNACPKTPPHSSHHPHPSSPSLPPPPLPTRYLLHFTVLICRCTAPHPRSLARFVASKLHQYLFSSEQLRTRPTFEGRFAPSTHTQQESTRTRLVLAFTVLATALLHSTTLARPENIFAAAPVAVDRGCRHRRRP